MALGREFDLEIKRIKGVLNPRKMAKEAYKVFLKNTPIRTGNARRKTDLDENTIKADYAYATRLDEGWSKQSPDGMTKPTLDFLKDYVKKQGGK